MNLVVEIGRLTRDPEERNGAVRFTTAVTRRFKILTLLIVLHLQKLGSLFRSIFIKAIKLPLLEEFRQEVILILKGIRCIPQMLL